MRAKFHLWPDGAIVAFLAIFYTVIIYFTARELGGFWMWFMIFLASATAFFVCEILSFKEKEMSEEEYNEAIDRKDQIIEKLISRNIKEGTKQDDVISRYEEILRGNPIYVNAEIQLLMAEVSSKNERIFKLKKQIRNLQKEIASLTKS